MKILSFNDWKTAMLAAFPEADFGESTHAGQDGYIVARAYGGWHRKAEVGRWWSEDKWEYVSSDCVQNETGRHSVVVVGTPKFRRVVTEVAVDDLG